MCAYIQRRNHNNTPHNKSLFTISSLGILCKLLDYMGCFSFSTSPSTLSNSYIPLAKFVRRHAEKNRARLYLVLDGPSVFTFSHFFLFFVTVGALRQEILD